MLPLTFESRVNGGRLDVVYAWIQEPMLRKGMVRIHGLWDITVEQVQEEWRDGISDGDGTEGEEESGSLQKNSLKA